MSTLGDRIREAAAAISALAPGPPGIAAVLGSGLGAAEIGLADTVVIPYAGIPHMPCPSVPGHAGHLLLGVSGRTRMAVLSGRVHLYEGWSVHDVTFGVRVMAALGCEALVVTNAAGSTRPDLEPGTLVLISDHLNLTGEDPTRGPEAAGLGTLFQDMTGAYDPALGQTMSRAASLEGIALRTGVYSAGRGPCYETPAEVRMLAGMGADLVGMSTVPEVMAARHSGMRVVGVSCVTNFAAGVGGSHPDHAEVKKVAGASSARLAALIGRFVAEYGEVKP